MKVGAQVSLNKMKLVFSYNTSKAITTINIDTETTVDCRQNSSKITILGIQAVSRELGPHHGVE